jgi:hypothetical protein
MQHMLPFPWQQERHAWLRCVFHALATLSFFLYNLGEAYLSQLYHSPTRKGSLLHHSLYTRRGSLHYHSPTMRDSLLYHSLTRKGSLHCALFARRSHSPSRLQKRAHVSATPRFTDGSNNLCYTVDGVPISFQDMKSPPDGAPSEFIFTPLNIQAAGTGKSEPICAHSNNVSATSPTVFNENARTATACVSPRCSVHTHTRARARAHAHAHTHTHTHTPCACLSR